MTTLTDNGYRKQTEDPIAYMVSYDPEKVEDGIGGRAELLASKDYDSPPLVDLMTPEIDIGTLETIKSNSEHENYAIRVQRWGSVREAQQVIGDSCPLDEYLYQDDFFRTINPRETKAFSNKAIFDMMIRDLNLPIIPADDIGGMMSWGKEYMQEQYGEFDKWLAQDVDRGGGYGIDIFSSRQEIRQILEKRGYSAENVDAYANSNHLKYHPFDINVQPYIEHESDLRIVMGDEVFSAENRFGNPEAEICNLTQIDANSILEKAVLSYDKGLADPLEPEEMPQEVIDLTEDIFNMVKESNREPSQYLLGVDIMVAERNSVEKLKPEFRTPALEYASEDKAYLLNEINIGFGGIIDRLHYWEGQEGSMPVTHTYNQLRKTAGMEPIDLSEVGNNPENPLRTRINQHYPDLEAARNQVGVQSITGAQNSPAD